MSSSEDDIHAFKGRQGSGMKIDSGGKGMGTAKVEIGGTKVGTSGTQYEASAKVVDASLACVDATLGVSATTGATVKDDSLDVKVLGTGITLGRKMGVSVFGTSVGIDFGRILGKD